MADDVDLTGIEWKRGAYDPAGLDRVYTGNDARALKVLRELRDKVTDVHRMRALGFCVSVAHAEYMARVFTRGRHPGAGGLGQHARRITGRMRSTRCAMCGSTPCSPQTCSTRASTSPRSTPSCSCGPRRARRSSCSSSVAGCDASQGKAVLTALDFIGQQRREFRFDVRYRALIGVGRKALERQIEQGFPFLPSGSQMVLDRVAQDIVLDNVRQQLRLTTKGLVAEVRSYGDLPLAQFLQESGRDLVDIYRGGGTWTALRRACRTADSGRRPG